ncbi:hypothetical protein BGLT_02942 [Caballeronia glathei]|uniref:Uncharacterized protein n=1 Tax=Caballeronia glathei TaxID=60547 RepID=A0A069PM53_9BURK|nr:hypothetical protein BG61_21900 [Caballeronia glathei]CDY73573.1 hypothetical protein BGLT_02942 [Caballeronia glathei]
MTANGARDLRPDPHFTILLVTEDIREAPMHRTARFNRGGDRRRAQGREFVGVAISAHRWSERVRACIRRVTVDFQHTRRPTGEHAQERRFIHPARLHEPGDVVIVIDAGTPELRMRKRDPGAQQYRTMQFAGQAHRAQAEVPADLQDQREHRRMQMKMLVRVHMVEDETGCRECLELGANLGGELRAHMRQAEEAHTVAGHRVVETALPVNQIRNRRRAERRVSVREHDVQADTQPRQLPRIGNRARRRRRADHQARGREHAVPVCERDSVIHSLVQAEIVGIDDDSKHA